MTMVEKIMRRDIVAARGDDSIVKAWRSMVEQGLSGVPVVDANGWLIGIVTEGDLVRRLIPRRTPRWWDLMFRDREALARDYRKAVGMTVADVMTSAPASIEPDASVGAAAALMNAHDISLLPVVEASVLVGVVTRAAVINEAAWGSEPREQAVSDDQLVQEMHERMEQEPWLSGRSVHARADHGILELQGLVDSQAERAGVVAMARAIPGCTRVEDHVLVRAEVLRRS